MSDTVVAALIGGIAGLVTGVIGSLVAPWVNWGIEKRRTRFTRRAQLVDQWRQGIAEAEAEEDAMYFGAFQRTAWLQSLARYSKPSRGQRVAAWTGRVIRKATGKGRPPTPNAARTIVVTDHGARHGTAVELSERVERLASRWGLD